MVRVLAAILLLIAAGLPPARAADAASDPASADGRQPVRTYVVGIEDLDYMPYYGTAADGAVDGAFRDLMDAFGADRGYRFDYRPMPIKRLFAALDRGDIDFKFPENPIWTHPEKQVIAMAYSRPLLLATDAGFVIPDRLGRPVAEVRTLGKILGFDLPFWRARPRPPEMISVQNVDSLVRIGLAGRVDAIHANAAVVEETLRRLNLPTALIRDPSLPHVDYDYRLGTAAHPEILRDLDAWMTTNPDRVRSLMQRRRVESPVG